jgi:hypothetical protein
MEKCRIGKGCVEKCSREKCFIETCPMECPIEALYLEKHYSPRCSYYTNLVYYGSKSRSLLD